MTDSRDSKGSKDSRQKKPDGAGGKSNDFEHVISSLLDNAGGVIASKSVVGEPVIVGDTTLIPLNDVMIGAGAGSNSGTDKNAGLGGFTAKMSPCAVLIIRGDVTKVVNVRTQDAVTKLVDMIPDVVDRILDQPAVRSMMGNDEAVAAAFPDSSESAEKPEYWDEEE